MLPLSNKGIFKNFVSMNFFIGEKLAFDGQLEYKSEEVMMRLVARIGGIVQAL